MTTNLVLIQEKQESCKTCKFFEKGIDNSSEEGTCRRNSPKPVVFFMTDDEFVANLELEKVGQVLWPQTFTRNYCGDWKEKSADEAQDE